MEWSSIGSWAGAFFLFLSIAVILNAAIDRVVKQLHDIKEKLDGIDQTLQRVDERLVDIHEQMFNKE